MAESYLTRRGSSGGGGLGGMNVTIGTSPPSDKVGLFVNSETIDTDVCYVSPNGISSSGGAWSILSGLTPENTNYSFPAQYGSTAWIGTATGALYSYDQTSEVFSNISTANGVYNGYSYIAMWYYEGDIYCFGNVGNAANDNSVYKYSPGAAVWTDTNTNVGSISIPFGCGVYNDVVYISASQYVSRRWGVAMAAYTMNSGTTTIIYNNIYAISDRIYFGTLIQKDNIMYTFGAQSSKIQSFALYYDVNANSYTGFYQPSSVANMMNTPCGFLLDNKLYCTGGNLTMLAEMSIPIDVSAHWQQSEMELPMPQSLRDHTGQCVNFGDSIYLFNCGANFQGIQKYLIDADFPTNSIVIEGSSTQTSNNCEIVSSENGNIVISVSNVYYVDSSGNASNITDKCQVRTTGGNWQQIQ